MIDLEEEADWVLANLFLDAAASDWSDGGPPHPQRTPAACVAALVQQTVPEIAALHPLSPSSPSRALLLPRLQRDLQPEVPKAATLHPPQ